MKQINPESTVPLSVSEALARYNPSEPGPFTLFRGELTDVRQTKPIYARLSDGAKRINCIIWTNVAGSLPEPLRSGQMITVLALLKQSPRGQPELEIHKVYPDSASPGPREAAIGDVRRRLASEGLTDPARKRPLPAKPARIGLVTAAGCEARADVEHVLERVPQITTRLVPVRVNGADAAPEVASAVQALSNDGNVDLVLITRGGGPSEDLDAFNTESVARAIAACRVPVLTAIGHTRDETVADAVADLHFATPSGAAEQIVRQFQSAPHSGRDTGPIGAKETHVLAPGVEILIRTVDVPNVRSEQA